MSGEALHYAEAEAIGSDEIPIIDFGRFLNGDAADRAAVAAEISAACRRIGFFYIVNHGVPEALRQNVLGEARSFFAEPMARKMECAPLKEGQWCGFVPSRGAMEGWEPGGSFKTADAERVSGGTLEQFNMMRVLNADDPNYGGIDPVYQRNLWPRFQPGFTETMIVNQRAVLKLSGELMAALSMALGVEEDFFARFHRSPLATFGLNHYPARTGTQPSDEVGVGAHCDASSFTVLLQDDVGGLEVRDPSGRWIAAPYVPGAYVINIGDTMMAWTNGHFVSTLHRVVSRRPVDRFSATMFMNPDLDARVAPLDAFLGEGEAPRFEPFNNGDYMKSFYQRFYNVWKKVSPISQ
ncbi:isopenicillin N synthase-like dioxygenase [Sphingomonas zeicaulis]|uniref:isopenicillin N synthase family dioxygenase n=1 Tax=Sphingomonas zeicaulis TaxID=1632740 RepID=UPI003D1DE43C